MSLCLRPAPRRAFMTSVILLAFSCSACCAVGACVRTPSETTASSGADRMVAVPLTVTVRPEVLGVGGGEVWASDGIAIAAARPRTSPATPHLRLPFMGILLGRGRVLDEDRWGVVPAVDSWRGR